MAEKSTAEPEKPEGAAADVGMREIEDDHDVRVAYAVRTHTGLVRDANEDDFLVDPDRGIYLVADGMGGHNAGAVASKICVETVKQHFEDNDESGHSDGDDDDVAADDLLAASLLHANDAIFAASAANRELAGMGTTAVGIRLRGNMLTAAHAGDSRCYIFRDGELIQVTTDHSLSNFLRSLGRAEEAAMAETTMSNVIMRALGLEPEVEIESRAFRVEPGDRILLCSDGLSDLVADPRIERMLMARRFTRDELADKLIDEALNEGGRDNVTVLIVDILDAHAEDEEAFDAGRTLRFVPVEDSE